MHGQQLPTQHFPRFEQVVNIGTGKILATITWTIFIDGTHIFGKLCIFKIYILFLIIFMGMGKCSTVASQTRWVNAIEGINAIFDTI
jgi:hypothetical protein